MKRLAIIGSGHLGQQIAKHAIYDNQFDVVGYFDDYHTIGTSINGIPILGNLQNIVASYQEEVFDELLIGIGYSHMKIREKIFFSLHEIVPFGIFIHSSCIVDKSSIVKKGTVIYPGCIIDQDTVIEENVLINLGCCISHNSFIGAHSFLAPRVAIAGFVEVNKSCILGINSTIIDNITVAMDTQLGAGTVVITDLKASGLYVGNPSRFIR